HWYFTDRFGVTDCKAFCFGSCSDSRRQRVTGIVRVHHAPTLDSLFLTTTSLWILFSIEIAVASRIAIDNATDSAVFGGNFRLDVAPTFTIARNHNGPLYRDAHAVELFIVFAIPIVHVHQRGGHITIDGISIVG